MPVKEGGKGFVKEAEIIPLLPRVLEGYEYLDVYVYPSEEYGYSIRYVYDAHNYADIYIYPVPEQVKDLGHKDIVYGMTGHAVSEIELAKEKGLYQDFEILNERAFDSAGAISSKVSARLRKKGRDMYTILYLTENSDKLIKARITMPDNTSNRANTAWDLFVSKLFGFIVDNIDKA